ncbi:hypothetical protein P5G65_24575 [Paenibacillus chondroitinus]|uniref:Uncharacterized protein n=1 Tax=Paenibacillus chondroitinus TaxID=59842 RepID=A0ABU6DH45_9BACL|nr:MULTISPECIES: hypothetical protein [Paenibacillus]MCY9661419.1 hypothetical protein [Paenibacillus anseongense]MEB4797082.1 hypothetical protein [Paenibacillus chondroitinus]
MKKPFKILSTGTLAAAILLSGSALTAGKAFADEAVPAAKSTLQENSFASQLINYHLSILAKDAAQATGKDEDDIRDALAVGDTLPEATGISSADLLSDLTPIITFDLHKASSYGIISADELLASEAAVAEQLGAILETKGDKLPTADSNAILAHLVMNRLDNVVRDTASFARKDQNDISEALRQGNTLVQSATSLDPGELKDDLLGLLKQDLQFQVSTYGMSQADADRFYALGAGKLSEIMNTSGYNPDSVKWAAKDLSKLVASRINRVITDTAFFARKDEKDVREDLLQGKTLVASAANLDPGELKEKISNVIRQDLDFVVAMGQATQEDANKSYAEAVSKIADIINTPGYTPETAAVQADLKNVVQARIDRVINDAAVFGKKEERDVREDLRQGKSLVASAARLDPGEFKEKVLNLLRQDLDFQVSLNRATQEDANKYYSEGAAKLTDIINAPGYTPESVTAQADLEKVIQTRIDRVINDTAVFGKREEKDVLEDLRQGKTLAASAANLDPGELKEKVLKVLRQDLDFQVSMHRATQADADKYYSEGALKLSEIINTPGYTPSKA